MASGGRAAGSPAAPTRRSTAATSHQAGNSTWPAWAAADGWDPEGGDQPAWPETWPAWRPDHSSPVNLAGASGWPGNSHWSAWPPLGQDRNWPVSDITSGSTWCWRYHHCLPCHSPTLATTALQCCCCSACTTAATPVCNTKQCGSKRGETAAPRASRAQPNETPAANSQASHSTYCQAGRSVASAECSCSLFVKQQHGAANDP
jgi:hypothetical protein